MSSFRVGVRGRSARQLADNPPSHPARPQHIAGQPGNDRDDAQAQKRRQIAQAQRPGDQQRRALSCRSCEDSPARHAGWSDYSQPGGPMTVAKLGSNGPMTWQATMRCRACETICRAQVEVAPMAATPTGLAPTPRPLPSQYTPVAHHVSQIARGRTETRVHVPGGGNPDPAVFPGPQHRDLAEPAPLVAVPADMQDHLRHCSVGTTSRTASGCRRFEAATGCVSCSGSRGRR